MATSFKVVGGNSSDLRQDLLAQEQVGLSGYAAILLW